MNATDLHERISALLRVFDGSEKLDKSSTSVFQMLVDVRDFLAALPPEVETDVPLELISLEAHRAQQSDGPGSVRIVPSGFITIEMRQMTELDALETDEFDATLAERFSPFRVTLYKRKQGRANSRRQED